MDKNIENQYTQVATKENETDEKDIKPESYGYGVRHVQLLLLFLCSCVSFIARSHIGVTVVAMTNRPHSNGTSVTLNTTNNMTWKMIDGGNMTFGRDNETEIVLNVDDDRQIMTYDWPKSVQEMILGAFFLGYSLMMFPMGLVCQRWGGKLPIQIALLINGLISLFAPWLIGWGGWKAVCACRIIQGLTQAGIFPSFQTLIAKWSHPSELGKFLSYVYTGNTLGTVLAFQVGGVLSASRWGWPSVFWATGAVCLITFAIFTFFGGASPANFKGVSEREKRYIMGEASGVKKSRRIPWKAILSSKHVWASICTHIGSGLSFLFFFNQVPSYIHYVLNVDVKKSGILSSLPYIAGIFSNLVFGFLSDFVTNRKILSIANSRRFFNSIAQFGVAVGLVAVSVTMNVELAVFALVVTLALHCAVHTGWMVNHIDMAPNFSGTLMSLGNTIICGLFLVQPVIVSHVITDVTNQIQWRIMFISMALLACITNLIFVVFMSADVQPWNNIDYEETETEEKEENSPAKHEQKINQ